MTTHIIDTTALQQSTTPYHLTAWASDLRLPVQAPTRINVGIGNGRAMILTSMTESEWRYQQEFGCWTLTIYND